MFKSARIRLTFYYTFIIMIIAITISGGFIFRASQALNQQKKTYETKLKVVQGNLIIQNVPSDTLESNREVNQALQLIIKQLIIINLLIFAFTAIASYYLAGITLAPIKTAMDEQKRFITDAAHELKTPVTALITSLEVNLMDKKITGKPRKILKENLKDINSLNKLVKNLLQLAKVGKNQSYYQVLKLKPLIDKSIKILKPLAQKKNITIKQTNSNPQTYIYGDETSIIEAVNIVLDNAIKYSPKKTLIHIRVKSTKKQVNITIIDQGVGISTEHLPHIFDRFYRVDSSRTKTDSSSFGLGLSVAKKIVKQHQGHIAVKSQPQKGSTFIITLPTHH